jgi:hypothetical protein
MTPIFPKQADKYFRIGLSAFLLAILGGVSISAYIFRPKQAETGYSPVQPVEYSHKLHAGNLGIDCRYCHSSIERAGFAAVPATETCMNCHTKVKPDSPLLQPVRESYASGRPIPWVHIHKLPDYVYFNHAAHLNAGVSCVTCHGRVDQMIQVRQVEPLTMKWCVDCHRNPAPHIRPRELVTKLDWKPDRDPAEIGRKLIAENHINPPANCSGCHR